MMNNKYRKYYIGGYDVSSYVKNVDGITSMQKKPEWGNMPETPRLEIELINENNNFCSSSDNSIFFGKTIKDISVIVKYQQGSTNITEWIGFAEKLDIDRQKKSVTLTAMTQFSKLIDSPAILVIDAATPASVSKQVFELFNIDVDESSYDYAINKQTNLVNVALDPNLLETTITLMEVQKQLATAGYARIYPYNGKMYYQVYEDDANPIITINLTDRDIMSHPKESMDEGDFTPYQVNYIDGTADSTSWTEGCSCQNFDFGPNAVVKIQSLTGATQVADQWEKISGLKKRTLEFAVKKSLGYLLNLNSFITINWKAGAIFNETFEVIGKDETDKKYSVLQVQNI